MAKDINLEQGLIKYLNMKYITVIIVVFILGCSDYQNKLEAEALESKNDDFNVYKGTKSYNDLINVSSIKYESEIADIDESQYIYYISLEDFDSIVYTYNETGLEINYYHLSSGCKDFIPILIVDTSYAIIRCRTINHEGHYSYEGNVLTFVNVEKACKNLMKWKINISGNEVNRKKIYFEPKKHKTYELVFDSLHSNVHK